MIRWEIGPMVRCDIIGYSGINYSGKRAQMRIFPTGSQQGSINGSSLGSLLLRAPVGVRITFISHPGDDWESYPWRSIVFAKASSIQSQKSKRLRAIRVPDLDYMDHFDAKTTNPSGSTGYPFAPSFSEANDSWTYGRQQDSGLKSNVEVIRIERMGIQAPPPPVAKDLFGLANQILTSPQANLRETVVESLVEHLVRAGMEEEPARQMAEKLP